MHSLEQKLARIDLNLLVSLSVLLKEKNVSRSAERLFLSQSAMSRILQRLRDLFEDPLFIRTATGIIPTEKAQSIEALLPDLLQKLEAILHDDSFSPASCDKHFSISLPTLASHAIFFPLVQSINIEAPAIQLSEHAAMIDPTKALASGYIDFSIHVEAPTEPTIVSSRLAEVSLAIFARKDHPLQSKKNVTLTDCTSYRFLDLLVQDKTNSLFTNPIDRILSEQGVTRNIQLQTTQLSIIAELLSSSDALLIAPSFFTNTSSLNSSLSCLYKFEPSKGNAVTLFLLQHQRTVNSAAHQWLANKIIELTKHSLS